MRANTGIKRHEPNAIALPQMMCARHAANLAHAVALLAAFAGIPMLPLDLPTTSRAVGFLLVLAHIVAVSLGKHLQSTRRISSPCTYSRCWANSTLKPLCGERCMPVMTPSTV